MNIDIENYAFDKACDVLETFDYYYTNKEGESPTIEETQKFAEAIADSIVDQAQYWND